MPRIEAARGNKTLGFKPAWEVPDRTRRHAMDDNGKHAVPTTMSPALRHAP